MGRCLISRWTVHVCSSLGTGAGGVKIPVD